MLIVLASCGQAEKRTENKIIVNESDIQKPRIKPTLVDYKSDTYKIFIGDNYTTSDKIIDWHWAALNDNDNKVDSTGKDAFLFLGEPLIKYYGSEYLPSLHITTDKNIITSFTCSVLFDLEDTSSAIEDFLELLSKDIKQLKNKEIVAAILTKGKYELTDEKCVSTIVLKIGKGNEHDVFNYTVTAR